MHDISVFNAGSVVILSGATDAGKAWLEEKIPHATRWGVGGYVVEPRYVQGILDGAEADGLQIEGRTY